MMMLRVLHKSVHDRDAETERGTMQYRLVSVSDAVLQQRYLCAPHISHVLHIASRLMVISIQNALGEMRTV